jgi:hypothetical protein
MRIEVLTELLKDSKGPGAWAESKGKVGGVKKSKIAVYFGSGRVYEYAGSVYQVAEKLNLIPAWNVVDESNRIASLLLAGQVSVIGFTGCHDTLRHVNMPEYWIESSYVGKDEYDRELSEYRIGERPNWA